MQQNVLFFLKHKNSIQLFDESLSFRQGLNLMRKHGFTAMPVISRQGTYLGTVTEGDFLYWLQDNYGKITQKDLDTCQVKNLIRKDYMPAVKIDIDLQKLFEASLKQNFVPVVDDRDIFIGIVTRQQIISYLMDCHLQPDFLDNSVSQSYFNQLNQQF